MRRRIMSECMEKKVEEWELIVDIITEEEQAGFNEEFEKSYKELDIFIKIVGTEKNTDSNKNAEYDFGYGSSKGYVGGAALSKNVTRIAHFGLRNHPYRQGEYVIDNMSSEKGGTTSHVGEGSYYDVNNKEDFGGFNIRIQRGVFGVGSRLIIYGR